MAATKQTPQDRRFAGIRSIGEKFIRDGDVVSGVSREDVAQEIEKLACLGRTVHWKNAVAYWAEMVRTENSLQWAIIQGQIYTGYANV